MKYDVLMKILKDYYDLRLKMLDFLKKRYPKRLKDKIDREELKQRGF